MKLLIDAIFPPRENELCVQACTKDALSTLLSPTVVPSETHGAIGLLPYGNEAVQACVIEAKFHDNSRAAQLLGNVLREYLREFIIETIGFSQEKIIFVPIPLSQARSRSRGYNQTERIAAIALTGIEEYIHFEPSLLVRTRDTLPQTTLGGDARRQNIQGAFAAPNPCNPAHTYIVFDDVITTGATLSAAVETLTNAGAMYVTPLALAH